MVSYRIVNVYVCELGYIQTDVCSFIVPDVLSIIEDKTDMNDTCKKVM